MCYSIQGDYCSEDTGTPKFCLETEMTSSREVPEVV